MTLGVCFLAHPVPPNPGTHLCVIGNMVIKLHRGSAALCTLFNSHSFI